MAGIYKIVNVVDDKFYIGSTSNFIIRKRHHWKALRHGYHYNTFLQRAWDKYGEDKFRFDVVIYCSEEDLIFFEQRFIDYYELPNECIAYNLSPDANTFRRYKQSKDHVMKRKLTRIGVPLNDEWKKSISKSKCGVKNFNKRIELDLSLIVSKYKSGRSGVEIAKEFGVRPSVIYRRLEEEGIVRKHYTGEKDLDVSEIKCMRKAGMSIYAIAKQFEVSRTAIETKIKKMV